MSKSGGNDDDDATFFFDVRTFGFLTLGSETSWDGMEGGFSEGISLEEFSEGSSLESFRFGVLVMIFFKYFFGRKK